MYIRLIAARWIAGNNRPATLPRTCSRCFSITRLFLAIDWVAACFAFLAGAARALEFAVVVVPAAILLPAGDVLRDDQVSGDGDSWASGRLGKTRTQSDRRSWTLIQESIDVAPAKGVYCLRSFCCSSRSAFVFSSRCSLPNDEPDDGRVYSQIARNILEQHVYSMRARAPYEPSLNSSSRLPAFPRGHLFVFGHGNNTAVRVVQAVIDTLTCVLMRACRFSVGPVMTSVNTAAASLRSRLRQSVHLRRSTSRPFSPKR